jgi:hypothetical protein
VLTQGFDDLTLKPRRTGAAPPRSRSTIDEVIAASAVLIIGWAVLRQAARSAWINLQSPTQAVIRGAHKLRAAIASGIPARLRYDAPSSGPPGGEE